MTNTQNLGTIEPTNPVLTVAPQKEDAEMYGATDKITALYCRLSQEDDRAGESLSIENHDKICQGGFLPKYIIITTGRAGGFRYTKSYNAGAVTLPHYVFSISIKTLLSFVRLWQFPNMFGVVFFKRSHIIAEQRYRYEVRKHFIGYCEYCAAAVPCSVHIVISYRNGNGTEALNKQK